MYSDPKAIEILKPYELRKVSDEFMPFVEKFAPNSIAYLESAIRKTTLENKDEYLDTIIPRLASTKWGMVPILEFASSTSPLALPEFYNNYPILTSADTYDSLENTDYAFYKIVPDNALVSVLEDGVAIGELLLSAQIIPIEDASELKGEIASVHIYCYAETTEYQFVEGSFEEVPIYHGSSQSWTIIDSDQFVYDYSTGVITIADTDILALLSEKIDELEDTYGVTPFLVFEVHVGRYRPITDTSNYLESDGIFTEQTLNRIGIMQAAEASILEYFQVYISASKEQTAMCEIAYTVTLTAVSVVTSMAIIYGASQAVSYLSNVGAIGGSSFTASFLQSSIGINGFGIAQAVMTEVAREIFIDPWLKALVDGFLRELGVPDWLRIILVSLAEGLREQAFGPFTSILKGGEQQTVFDTQQYKEMTVQQKIDFILAYKQQLKLEQGSWTSQLGKTALMALGFLYSTWMGTTSMFFGSAFTASIATVSIYFKTEGISLKETFANLFGKSQIVFDTTASSLEQLDAISGKTEVSDQKKYHWGKILKYTMLGIGIGLTAYSIASGVIATLSPTQVPVMRQFMVDTSKELAESTVRATLSTTTSIGSSNMFIDGIKSIFSSPYSLIGISSVFAGLSVMTKKTTYRLKEKYPLRDILRIYREVFTMEEDTILTNLEDLSEHAKNRLSFASTGRLMKDLDKNLITLGNLYALLDIVDVRTIKEPKVISSKRWLTYYKFYFLPFTFKARTNSIKSKVNFQLCINAINKFLYDIGADILYMYKIYEAFNDFSDRPQDINFKDIIRVLKIPSHYYTPLRGKHKDTFKEISPFINRLINIYLLKPSDVVNLGITDLKGLKQKCFSATMGVLLHYNMLDTVRGLEKFKMIFNILLGLNYKQGGGNIIPYGKIYDIKDLSQAVSTSIKMGDARRYLIRTLLHDGPILPRTLSEFLDILESNDLTDSNSEIKSFFNEVRLQTPYGSISNYIFKYRPYSLSIGEYNEFFLKELLIPQQKEMIDISLGLDVILQKFYPNKPHPGISRHHPDRDKPWFTVFEFKVDSNTWKVKLIPLDHTYHLFTLHQYYKTYNNFEQYHFENDLARARITHLVELIYLRKYNPRKDYYTLFMNEFDQRMDEVAGNMIKIWDGFKRNILSDWIDRWIARQKMSEKEWYKEYYKDFWGKTYIPYLDDFAKYLLGDKCKNPDFWRWFMNTYLKENYYPQL